MTFVFMNKQIYGSDIRLDAVRAFGLGLGRKRIRCHEPEERGNFHKRLAHPFLCHVIFDSVDDVPMNHKFLSDDEQYLTACM